MDYRAYLFDLDETLAESFMPPTREMTEKVRKLLEKAPVAIVTGRDFPRVELGFLPFLTDSPQIDQFYVMPESSARCLQFKDGEWFEHYSFHLNDEERKEIRDAIEESVSATGVLVGLPQFGERYREKTAQTAYAMLGLDVPSVMKYTWDIGNVKRKALQSAIAERLPNYEVLLGGATSIDVTKKGVDKSYGVMWLSKHLNIPPQEMLYIGDALEEGGNDSMVIPTGIQTRATSGPEQTENILDEILAKE